MEKEKKIVAAYSYDIHLDALAQVEMLITSVKDRGYSIRHIGFLLSVMFHT